MLISASLPFCLTLCIVPVFGLLFKETISCDRLEKIQRKITHISEGFPVMTVRPMHVTGENVQTCLKLTKVTPKKG